MIRHSPSLKILIVATFGFIFTKFISFSLFGLIVFFIYLFIFLLLLSFLTKNKFPIYLYFAFVFGILTALRTHYLDYDSIIECNKENNGIFNGKVSKVLKTTPKYTRAIVEGKILNDKWEFKRSTRFLLTIINSHRHKFPKIDNNDFVSGLAIIKSPTIANLPNEFNEQNYLRNSDCEFSVIGFSSKVSLISVDKPPSYREIALKSMFDKIDEMYPRSIRGIVKAILLGDRTELHPSVRQEFAVTGVAHILAVSGFHVGIIAGLLFWMFSFIRNHYFKFILIAISLFGYIYLVDFQPSAVRAGIMILLFLFAYLIQRKPNPINIIATTILLVALVHPASLYSVGFQMSIAAISGIFLLYKPIKNFLDNRLNFQKNPIVSRIGNSLAVSLSASIVVSPIVAFYFGIYSIISPLANLIVIPFMMFGQLFGIAALVSSYLIPQLGQIFASTSQLSIEIASYITHHSSQLSFAYISGESVTTVSIIVSIFLTYLLLAKCNKVLLFRFIVVVFFSFMLILREYTFSKPNVTIYERPNSFYIENTSKNSAFLVSKKDCRSNWEDYGLINHLKNNPKHLYIHNIPQKMKYKLWKNQIKYRKIPSIQYIRKSMRLP